MRLLRGAEARPQGRLAGSPPRCSLAATRRLAGRRATVASGIPVVQEEARFEEEAARLIPHLPDRAREVVRNLQPFAWGAGEYDLLASLDELAAIDRPREVALFAAVVEITGVGWKRTVPGTRRRT